MEPVGTAKTGSNGAFSLPTKFTGDGVRNVQAIYKATAMVSVKSNTIAVSVTEEGAPPPGKFNVKITSVPEIPFRFTLNGNQMVAPYTISVPEGDSITVTIVDTEHETHRFKEWEDGSTSVSRTLTVDKDLTLTAHYEVAEVPSDKGVLDINTFPVKGEIYVNGERVGVAPQAVEVDPGTYEVSFGKVEGYVVPSSRTVTVKAGGVIPLSVTYEVETPVTPETGSIDITTRPIDGVALYVNGNFVGRSSKYYPFYVEVPAGRHTVSFGDVGGYVTPSPQTVDVGGGEKVSVIGDYEAAPRPPAKGYIEVNTSPVKGMVYLDNSPVGVAPQTVETSPGYHTVSFGDVEGYYTPPSRSVYVYEDATVTVIGNVYDPIPVAPPTPGKGYIAIDTTPINEQVYVDGISKGLAPQVVAVDPGTHTVSFGENPYYLNPSPRTVTVAEGQTVNVVGTYEAWAFFGPPIKSY